MHQGRRPLAVREGPAGEAATPLGHPRQATDPDGPDDVLLRRSPTVARVEADSGDGVGAVAGEAHRFRRRPRRRADGRRAAARPILQGDATVLLPQGSACCCTGSCGHYGATALGAPTAAETGGLEPCRVVSAGGSRLQAAAAARVLQRELAVLEAHDDGDLHFPAQHQRAWQRHHPHEAGRARQAGHRRLAEPVRGSGPDDHGDLPS